MHKWTEVVASLGLGFNRGEQFEELMQLIPAAHCLLKLVGSFLNLLNDVDHEELVIAFVQIFLLLLIKLVFLYQTIEFRPYLRLRQNLAA